ncbi:MAG: DUF4214 domain-containing protein, partial [Candidatus Saccharimonadales bacterium]
MYTPFGGWSRLKQWFEVAKKNYWQSVTRFYIPRQRAAGRDAPVGRPRRFSWLPYHGIRYQSLEARALLNADPLQVAAAQPSDTSNVAKTAPLYPVDTQSVGVLPPGIGYLEGTPGDGTNQTFVQNLYNEMLGRQPDPTGQASFNNYLSQNNNDAGRNNVVTQFLNSPEYKMHYVDTVYGALLHRVPDDGGLNFWVDKLGEPGT